MSPENAMNSKVKNMNEANEIAKVLGAIIVNTKKLSKK